jgi:hypothetical protein
MTDKRPPPPPKGLELAGRRLWKQVTKVYKLRVDEFVLLESACKTVDLIADLEAAMTGQPLTTVGSMGQEREHPLLSEMRMQRTYLNRTLAQLKLPDDASGAAAPNQQRAAAQSRWAQTHAAEGAAR